jgi:lipoate-protein ligase A
MPAPEPNMETWRLLDTGARTAFENMAFDDALLLARSRGISPNTLRLLQFSPNAALVGFHQNVEQELRVDYCRKHGIDIARRITGGGALYFDETQVGGEVIADKGHPKIPNRVEDLYEVLCEGTVAGLRHLGVESEFRPKNDIEVAGRKISGTGGVEEGDAFLFQGTLLVDFDVDTMLRALRIPTEKLKDKELDSVKDRVTCLSWELDRVPPKVEIQQALVEGFSEIFDVRFERKGIMKEELELFDRKMEKHTSREWIYGTRRPIEARSVLRSMYKTEGGLIRVAAVVDTIIKQIKSILITGDFFAYPQRTILDLEARLKYASADYEDVENNILDFFEETKPQIPGVEAKDFVKAVLDALKKADYERYGIGIEDANRIFTVAADYGDVEGVAVMLLPYCAKGHECGYRHERDCTICGDCTVGDAYGFGEKYGLKCISILNYEDLQENLENLKEKGVKAYVGCCCEAFFAKHQDDFERIGLPCILVDIDNTTCYDFDLVKEAELGQFENLTNLKLDLLEKVLGDLHERGCIRTDERPP